MDRPSGIGQYGAAMAPRHPAVRAWQHTTLAASRLRRAVLVGVVCASLTACGPSTGEVHRRQTEVLREVADKLGLEVSSVTQFGRVCRISPSCADPSVQADLGASTGPYTCVAMQELFEQQLATQVEVTDRGPCVINFNFMGKGVQLLSDDSNLGVGVGGNGSDSGFPKLLVCAGAGATASDMDRIAESLQAPSSTGTGGGLLAGLFQVTVGGDEGIVYLDLSEDPSESDLASLVQEIIRRAPIPVEVSTDGTCVGHRPQ